MTQNIDGLHQLAGHLEETVIELHGTNRKIECQTCGQLSDPDPAFEEFKRSGEPPLCSCKGFLKPATVSFGQAMPQDKLREAFAAASRADLVIAVGSTLEVEPAASVPRSAKEHGAVYVIVNQGPTAHDQLADLRIEGDATQTLPEAVRALRKRLTAVSGNSKSKTPNPKQIQNLKFQIQNEFYFLFSIFCARSAHEVTKAGRGARRAYRGLMRR